mgnify:CR=1 FL=1|jgi:hypothetical protein
MLPGIRNDLMYLLNILESIEKILLYSKDCNGAETFYELNDQLNFNASLNLFANRCFIRNSCKLFGKTLVSFS